VDHINDIGFSQASFSWSMANAESMTTPNGSGFRLKVEKEIVFRQNALNLVIGKRIA